MKKLLRTPWFVFLILTVFVLLPAFHVGRSRPILLWNPRCHVGIALLKPHWRSWKVEYCHGFQIIDGKEKHLYHWPKFYHADVAEAIKAMDFGAKD